MRIQRALMIQILALALGIVSPAHAEILAPFVVELYTAQGCPSCPPADRVLAALAKRSDIIALALHVDYWDKSWPDQFAFPDTKARHKRYRVAFRNEQAYTPQLVIDGAIELPGNNPAAVAAALKKAAGKKEPGPAVALSRTELGLSVAIEPFADARKAEVWFAAFDAEHTQEITRGQNRGSTVVNVNIVRELKSLGQYTGTAFGAQVPLQPADKRGLAVLVQTMPLGKIYAAAALLPAP